MKRVFADSYYFFALLNQNEPHHSAARKFADDFRGEMVTTPWVLTELADGLAKPKWRNAFVTLYDELIATPHVRLITSTDELFDEGFAVYRNRPDKSWSLTDCISFAVMEMEGIREAL